MRNFVITKWYSTTEVTSICCLSELTYKMISQFLPGMKNLSTVEMYNPDTNEWSFVASMEKHEGGVGVGVIPMEE